MNSARPVIKGSKKSVLIVEDSETQRLSLHKAIEMRGFQVYSAANVNTAREQAQMLGNRLDVMVLDIRLEDPVVPAITGLDLGIEIRSSDQQWPPEFLIHSAFEEVDYYRLAFRLGAGAYLRKEAQFGNHQLIRHVRALALRRGLSVERPGTIELVKQIAETSLNQTEAVAHFCNHVLAPELSACLGAPFVILLTDEKQTICCSNNAGLPERLDPIYERIQALAQGKRDMPDTFVLDTNKLIGPEGNEEAEILRKLEGSSFLPLSTGSGLRLCIGILNESREKNPLAEDPQELSKVLIRYLQQAVMESLLTILSQWSASVAARKALLSATAQVCLYVGQQQAAILSELKESAEDKSSEKPFQKLSFLAQGVRQTGEILAQILAEGESPGVARKDLVSMRDVLEAAREDLTDQLDEGVIEISGDCEIQGSLDDLFIAASRIIHWFVYRGIEISFDESPIIRIFCAATPEGSIVTFQDRSHRLSKQLREQLFFPFTQVAPLPSTSGRFTGPGLHLPIFLSKVLVEVRNHGLLEDLTDELEGGIGHRFVMRFPIPKG